MSHLEILGEELRQFQLDLPPEQKLTLSKYCDELVRWNEKINLTGLSGAAMVRRLVVEPVWIALQLQLSGKLIDIGSGNGSPAIPFHVVSAIERSYLVEARTKRAVFLRNVVSLAGLSGIVVRRARFEETLSSLEKVDWISLQGVQFSARLIDSIREVSSATTVIIWITSLEASRTHSRQAIRTLEVPLTGTCISLFRPDHF